MTAEDRQSIKALRELSKTLDPKRFEAHERSIGQTLEGLAELAHTERQHHNDNQAGWSKLDARLVEATAATTTLTQRVSDLEKRYNDKFREVEASVGSLRRQLNDLVADAISEAKDAIMAEAHAAAVEAVSNLLGDGPADAPPAALEPGPDIESDVEF